MKGTMAAANDLGLRSGVEIDGNALNLRVVRHGGGGRARSGAGGKD